MPHFLVHAHCTVSLRSMVAHAVSCLLVAGEIDKKYASSLLMLIADLGKDLGSLRSPRSRCSLCHRLPL